MRKILAILLASMLMVLGPARVMGQAQAPISPQARLDDAKGTLDRVETTLTQGELTEAQLQALRGDVDPVGLEMTALAGELAPRIDAAKARLAQLGPKPDANAPPEPADVSAERGAQDKLFDDLDATVKRARVLAVQASQISDGIGARLRAAFAHALFERAPSLLSPSLWRAVLREMPYDYRAVMSETSYFSASAWRRLDVWERFTLPALLALLVLLYWPVWQLAVRVRSRNVEATPSRLRKAMAALRVALATAAVPVGTVLALGGLVTLFDLPTQFHRIGLSLSLGVSVVAAMTGLARGLLAPKSPNWRLVPVADFGAKTLYHVVISICCVVAVEKLIEAVNELIGVALPTAIATRGLGALAVAGVLLFEIRKGRRLRAAAKDVVATAQMQHWAAIMRLVAWAIVLVLIGSVLVGYVAFASFVVEQIIAVAGTLALLYILLAVADDGFAAAFRAKGLLGRTLIATLEFAPTRSTRSRSCWPAPPGSLFTSRRSCWSWRPGASSRATCWSRCRRRSSASRSATCESRSRPSSSRCCSSASPWARPGPCSAGSRSNTCLIRSSTLACRTRSRPASATSARRWRWASR